MFPTLKLSTLNIQTILKYSFTEKKEVWQPHCPHCKKEDNFKAVEFLGDFNRRGYFIYNCEKCNKQSIVIFEIYYDKNKKEKPK